MAGNCNDVSGFEKTLDEIPIKNSKPGRPKKIQNLCMQMRSMIQKI